MCGRFVTSSSAERIAEYFGASFDAETTLPENYNTAPTNDIYGVVAGPDGHADVAGVPLGPRAGVGEGHQDRLEDDQCPRRDDRREAGVQVGVQEATQSSFRWTVSSNGNRGARAPR